MRYLEQACVTSQPIWATAAGIGLFDRLDELRDAERVAILTEWIEQWGDSALATELLFFDR